MDTTAEKFQAATLSLACGGSLKERLTHAYRNHLALVSEEELPQELREEFRNLSSTLTREPPLIRGEDAFRATIRKMSGDEVEQAACAVVMMFAAVSRDSSGGGRHRIGKGLNVVPLHAVKA